MYVYVATTNEIEAIFSPPQGGLKRNEIEHHKVLYFVEETMIGILLLVAFVSTSNGLNLFNKPPVKSVIPEIPLE